MRARMLLDGSLAEVFPSGGVEGDAGVRVGVGGRVVRTRTRVWEAGCRRGDGGGCVWVVGGGWRRV